MDYEKKYKEALELARVAAFNGHQSLMEGIFPELAESEDEKIRKELIDIVEKSPITFAFEDKGKVLAWLKNIPYTIDHEKREGFYLGYKAGLEKQGDHKLAWSEEDKEMCQETIDWFEKKCFPYALENDNPARESIKWLKSLKDRVQPKQEWTEDDKRILDALITSLINERFAGRLKFLKGIKVSSVIDWLKSLKEKIKKENK